MITSAVITVSDRASQGIYEDISGKVIKEILLKNEIQVASHDIIPDDPIVIKDKLIYYSDTLGVDLILTSGGTGFGPRDNTPEATMEIISKVAFGISDYVRQQGSLINKKAVLSRGVSGIRNKTLIINLPGSPKGAEESLSCILDLISHAVDMLKGKEH